MDESIAPIMQAFIDGAVPLIIDDGAQTFLRINRTGQPPEDIPLTPERLAAIAVACCAALRREVQRRG